MSDDVKALIAESLHAAEYAENMGWLVQSRAIRELAVALEASVQAPAVEAFIVRDVDGTSFTGTSKIIGVALSREAAERHADEVKKRDSWHEGSIAAVPILRAQQVREGN